jgi:WD40 repeat protein
VPKLRLQETGTDPDAQGGEIFHCAFSHDSQSALTGSWDGKLRIWDVGSGQLVSSILVGPKPLSACAASPDGKLWLAGSMEGILSCWDAASQKLTLTIVPHTRPVSTITFGVDGQTVATASWDKKLTLRTLGKLAEGKTLVGHDDIVAGCRFLPEMTHLLSWSHDGTLALWDVASGQRTSHLKGHHDRVNCAAVSLDGRSIVSASRDRELTLWDWTTQQAVRSVTTEGEVRALFFLGDGKSVVAVDQEGWLTLFTTPELEAQEEVETGLKVQCGELSPCGTRIALGCEDGRIGFVAVDGVERAPIPVLAKKMTKEVKRFLRKNQVQNALSCTCPACHHSFELPGSLPGIPAPCPHCQQALRFSGVMQAS